ncbi:MAG: hypothetical protein ACM31H_00415 [Nitrososphaerales archaeon]
MHHIDENPSNNEINNLVPICYDCHKKMHGKSKADNETL